MGCWSMILVQAGRISNLKKYSRTDLTLEVTPWAGPLVCYSRHFRQSEIRPLTKSKSASYEHTHTRWVTYDADNFCFQLHCCITWESSTEAKAVYISIIQFLASKKAAQKKKWANSSAFLWDSVDQKWPKVITKSPSQAPMQKVPCKSRVPDQPTYMGKWPRKHLQSCSSAHSPAGWNNCLQSYSDILNTYTRTAMITAGTKHALTGILFTKYPESRISTTPHYLAF